MDNRRESGLWGQTAEGLYERKAPAGPFQYYKPPPPSDTRRPFADRAGASPPTGTPTDAPPSTQQDDVRRSSSKRQSEAKTPRSAPTTHQRKLEKIHTGLAQQPDAAGAQVTSATHASSVPQRASPEYDDVPANLRSKPWSPEPLSSGTAAKVPPVRHASNASNHIRRGSVPERSPLQNLEVRLDTISKEGKRARLEEAEKRAQQKSLATREGGGVDLGRSATLRSEKGRAVSDGNRRANDSAKRDEKRQASAGAAVIPPIDRFKRASDALRTEIRENSPPKAQRDATSATRDAADPATQPGMRQSSEPRASSGAVEGGQSGVGRTQSQKYRHRARVAGFIGAAAAMAGAAAEASPLDSAAARGKAAYERRKSQAMDSPLASPTSPTARKAVSRDENTRLQKRPPTSAESQGRSVYGVRGAATGSRHTTPTDAISRERLRLGENGGMPYQPQMAAGSQSKEKVRFAQQGAVHDDKGHHLRDMFHRHHADARVYQPSGKALEEWREASVAKLTAADLILDDVPATATAADQKDAAWWDNERRQSTNIANQHRPFSDGPYEEESQSFRPPLFLKCGPLLRFTGTRKDSPTETQVEREYWRGSIMIVTEDASSDHSTPPVLRIFAQAMDLHQPPAKQGWEGGHTMAPEDEDPVTGQVKMSRTGRPIYVRPVHDIDAGVDLSREENNQGLFSATRSPVLGPQSVTGPDGRQSQHITFQNKSRIRRRDGERLGKRAEVRGHRLHAEHGCTFWRFLVEIELGPRQARVAYRINRGPAVGFWVPAAGETMNMMFHSCNGFSLSVKPDAFSGPDPLWRDVLNRHQRRPFHAMIGGGDQIYNDAAMRDTQHFKEWLATRKQEDKSAAAFSAEMQEELEAFYFNRYAAWFSQGLFGMANAQIAMVNMWDDHDIIDGFGSYPHHFMSSPVFAGVGAVAFKYYMLFQHQSVAEEAAAAEEASWVLGAGPGPYIRERSRSVFVRMGGKAALLALDCRTERMRDEVLSQESYDAVFDRCRAELAEGGGETRHLMVLLGVPIAYPRLNFLENILTSRMMDPIKAMGRAGALGGFINKFDGGVEILDDLDDHWTAREHKTERNWFVQELQELAAERSVRVTILGGDVHLAAVGQFYSARRLGLAKDRDHRYMPNVVSSAIVNTPPPVMMADVLNRRNRVHHLDGETDEDMIPMFEHDVDGSRRNNRHLLPRRNFATICEYVPGNTPPPSAPTSAVASRRPSVDAPYGGGGGGGGGYGGDGVMGQDERRYPPGSMLGRTVSLGRGAAGGLVRRLSGSRGRNPPVSFVPVTRRRSADNNSAFIDDEDTEPSRPGTARTMQRSSSMGAATADQQGPPVRPTFHRRPTSLSVKEARRAAARGGSGGGNGEADQQQPAGHIDLEGGLDISLCVEVAQGDPAGHTAPYRLLVPALWYEGSGDANTAAFKRPSLFHRLTGQRHGHGPGHGQDEYEHDDGGYDDGHREDESRTETPTQTAGQAHMSSPRSRKGELEDLQSTAAGAGSGGRYGMGGPAGQPRAASQKSYALDGPPVGARRQGSREGRGADEGGGAGGKAWQRGYRRRVGPGQAGAGGGREEERREDEDGRDDDSLAASEEGQGLATQRRGLSKAERFFGIGDEGGPWSGSGGGGGGGGGGATTGGMAQDGGSRKKAGWMVWK